MVPATHKISYLAEKENKQVSFSKFHNIRGRQKVGQISFDSILF